MDNQENANCIPHEPVFSKCRGCDKLQRAYLMMNSETNLSRLIYDDDVNEQNKHQQQQNQTKRIKIKLTPKQRQQIKEEMTKNVFKLHKSESIESYLAANNYDDDEKLRKESARKFLVKKLQKSIESLNSKTIKMNNDDDDDDNLIVSFRFSLIDC